MCVSVVNENCVKSGYEEKRALKNSFAYIVFAFFCAHFFQMLLL